MFVAGAGPAKSERQKLLTEYALGNHAENQIRHEGRRVESPGARNDYLFAQLDTNLKSRKMATHRRRNELSA
jgi:hypothetical protein